MKNSPHGVSRRTFLKLFAGTLVTVNIMPLASMVSSRKLQQLAQSPTGSSPDWMAGPGKARYRIDGLAKVTGQKIYARDYHAWDMAGWPTAELPVMIVRASDVDHLFTGLDLSLLPPEFSPSSVIYGDALEGSVVLTNNIQRDVHLDAVEDDLRQRIDLPSDLSWPIIVPRGELADFYGQPVAFLLFPNRTAFLGAKKRIQFNPDFQQYGAAKTHAAVPPLQPLTNYVRIAGEGSAPDIFSYVRNGQDAEYDRQADRYRAQIQAEIDASDWRVYASDFSMQAMDPMFMEPETGLGWYDASSLSLNLVLGTQSPDHDVNEALTMLSGANPEVKIETVNLYSCYPGGGFGGRDSSVFTLNLIVAAAFANGQPVRLAYDRFEQFQCGLKRHACHGREQLAVDEDGKIQALLTQMQFDSGGRRNLSPYVAQLAGLCAGGSYVIPKAAVFSDALYSTNISGGSQRGFGGPQAYFIIESLMDEAAVDLGLDPFAIRRINVLERGGKTVVGGPVNQSLRFAEILDTAEAHPIWQERAAAKAKWEAEGLRYGVGFAMSMQAYGTSGDGLIGYIRLTEDGQLHVQTNAVDMGNGSATTLAVVPAAALGHNAATIDMGIATLYPQLKMSNARDGGWQQDDWSPKGVGSSSACLTAFHQVHAINQAAQVLFDTAVFPAAKAIWGTAADSLDAAVTQWVDGALTVPEGGFEPLSLPTIAAHIYANSGIYAALIHAYFQESWASATFSVAGEHTWAIDGLGLYYSGEPDIRLYRRTSGTFPPDEAARYVRTAYAPCGNLIGLTVDPATGRVTIRASLSVLNTGRIITEPLVSGQSQGGVAMAIGYSLLEDMPPQLAGPARGDWNLHRYQVPLAEDVAMQHQALVTLEPEKEEQTARGIAEAVMCAVAPAISNALFDATGKRFRDLPMSAARIREALHDNG